MKIPDPNGYNDYERPVIILTSSEDVSSGQLAGVVGSHTASNKRPRPHSYIEVPHHPQGRVATKLRKPTVAVCEWVVGFTHREIVRDAGGYVSKLLLEAIIDKRRELQSVIGPTAPGQMDNPSTNPPIAPTSKE